MAGLPLTLMNNTMLMWLQHEMQRLMLLQRAAQTSFSTVKVLFLLPLAIICLLLDRLKSTWIRCNGPRPEACTRSDGGSGNPCHGHSRTAGRARSPSCRNQQAGREHLPTQFHGWFPSFSIDQSCRKNMSFTIAWPCRIMNLPGKLL